MNVGRVSNVEHTNGIGGVKRVLLLKEKWLSEIVANIDISPRELRKIRILSTNKKLKVT